MRDAPCPNRRCFAASFINSTVASRRLASVWPSERAYAATVGSLSSHLCAFQSSLNLPARKSVARARRVSAGVLPGGGGASSHLGIERSRIQRSSSMRLAPCPSVSARIISERMGRTTAWSCVPRYSSELPRVARSAVESGGTWSRRKASAVATGGATSASLKSAAAGGFAGCACTGCWGRGAGAACGWAYCWVPSAPSSGLGGSCVSPLSSPSLSPSAVAPGSPSSVAAVCSLLKADSLWWARRSGAGVVKPLLLGAEVGANEAQPPLRRLYLCRESAFRTRESISYRPAGIGLGLRPHLTIS